MLKSRAAQRGLGMIELMVGITISLIIVAAASVMMVGQINEHRHLTLETQVQQDLRVASDLIVRDLRRAGFWAAPQLQVWAPGLPVAAADTNPYASTSGCSAQTTQTQLIYAFSKADYGRPGDGTNPQGPAANINKEYFGFRWRSDAKILDFMLGCANGRPNWQPLNDPATLRVTDFLITPQNQTVSLAGLCSKTCSDPGTCPSQQILRYDVTLTGQAAFDAKVVRTLRFSSRVRSDAITGACPA